MATKQEVRAFVAGATGYTGREVVRLLGERGIETHMHVRPDSSQLTRWQQYASECSVQIDTTPWRSQAFSHSIRRAAQTDPRIRIVGNNEGPGPEGRAIRWRCQPEHL